MKETEAESNLVIYDSLCPIPEIVVHIVRFDNCAIAVANDSFFE